MPKIEEVSFPQDFLSPPVLLTHSIAPWRWCSLLRVAMSDSKVGEIPDGKRPLLNVQDDEKKLDRKEFDSFLSPPDSRYNCFFDGVEMVTWSLWPPAFYIMFIYDWHHYIHSLNNRYQMSTADLVWGIPQNYDYTYASLTANLGGDIASASSRWINYWPWTFLVSAAILRGLVNFIYSRSVHHTDLDAFTAEEHSIQRTLGEKICDDFLRIALPLPTYFGFQLFIAQYALIQGYNHIQLDTDSHLLIEKTAEFLSFLAKYYALSALANLYHYASEQRVRQSVLKKLQELAEYKQFRKDPLANIYTNYKLWSIGKSRKKIVNLLCYSLIVPLQLFAQIRFWSLIVNKIN